MKSTHLRLVVSFALTLCFLFSYAQVTLRITSLPANTPAGATIYFAGSINAWNPASEAWKLTPDANGVPAITIPAGTGSVQYKFTLGGWDKVEKGPNGEEIANRTFTHTETPQTINLTVANWAGAPVSTAQPNVQILNNNFAMPQLGRSRRIWLYLPPDYAGSSKQYPVIYMHDGQNLFDNATAFSGEWQVDETLNRLHAEGDYGAIVVGIDNGGGQRLNEYSPWNNPSYGGGQGDAYIDFIAQTLKPYMDANFRTLSGPAHTALFGSSMGGLISLYGALKYPGVFGKVGSFSPAYWFALTNLNSYITGSATSFAGLRLSHVAGQNETANLVGQLQQVTANLHAKGLTVANYNEKIHADGAHSEWYWRREFAASYQWLFAGSILPVQLGSFTLTTISGCGAELVWQTKSESNNKGFYVQHSTDGTRFETLGFVKGKGTASSPTNYRFSITLPAKEPAFYRLQQEDNDGKHQHSAVLRAAPCRSAPKAAISPNPSRGAIRLQHYQISPTDAVTLHSSDGRAIKTYTGISGNTVDISALPPNTYAVMLNGMFIGKCIKL